MFGSSLITRGKGLAFSKYGTEAERVVAPYLFDDPVQVMSSFEMKHLSHKSNICIGFDKYVYIQ